MAIESIQSKTVAILGYGNQGRAHALNLKDSGVSVVVGARPSGKAWKAAMEDGFSPVSLQQAAERAQVIMLLLPDASIASVFQELVNVLKGKWIGFAHGFAYHFHQVPRLPECQYFLVAPKGAGALLRARFVSGEGLPTVYAIVGEDPGTRALAESYARAIAGNTGFIRETSFQWETEGDLFGEQTVLVGGVMELMRAAFETLVKNGLPPEMAFFDVCQELRATVELFLSTGPCELTHKISPTALYGAATRGPRVVHPRIREQMQQIFDEIRSGAFARELEQEIQAGGPTLESARRKDAGSEWERAFEALRNRLL